MQLSHFLFQFKNYVTLIFAAKGRIAHKKKIAEKQNRLCSSALTATFAPISTRFYVSLFQFTELPPASESRLIVMGLAAHAALSPWAELNTVQMQRAHSQCLLSVLWWCKLPQRGTAHCSDMERERERERGVTPWLSHLPSSAHMLGAMLERGSLVAPGLFTYLIAVFSWLFDAFILCVVVSGGILIIIMIIIGFWAYLQGNRKCPSSIKTECATIVITS